MKGLKRTVSTLLVILLIVGLIPITSFNGGKGVYAASGSEIVEDALSFAVECRVKSYDPETWRLVGEIVNVSLDERILGENGKVSFDKFHPLAFDWMNKIYLSLGEKVGNAYKDGLALR